MSDGRTVEQVVSQIPKDWAWCLEQPPKWNKNGKKPKRYTAFVANEYYIGDWRYASTYVDDNDPVHALQSAYNKVLDIVAAKRKAEELGRQKQG